MVSRRAPSAVGSPDHATAGAGALTYDHALSAIRGPWRGVLAIVTFVLAFLVVSTVFGFLAVAIDALTGATDLDTVASGRVSLTPTLLLMTNLSLVACIPLAGVLQRAFFGVRFGSLSSVVGRFRWRWMGRLALIIVPVWVVYVGVGLLLDPAEGIRIDGGVILLLAIVVVTTPLQAAGEEYGARGLILRSAASWFRNPWLAFAVGAVISGALFSLAHFAADPWLIAYYFVFGVSAAYAARGTGGLEAPVLIHATNNVLLFIPAVLYGQLDESIDRSEGTGSPAVLIPMALCVAAALVSSWWARRNGVVRSTPPLVPVRAEPGLPRTAEEVRAAQANTFGRAAGLYDRARPDYPAEVVRWLVPAGTPAVLDLGAGTGKFTASLVGLATEVIAVDPDPLMLGTLATRLPAVRGLRGTAEQIPLPDASVDVVTVAQAWHWVDEARALPEIARVLRPGGRLGLVWNIRDESVPWVARLSQVMGSSAAETALQRDITLAAPFGTTEQLTVSWSRTMTPEGLIELVASRSYIITADESTRERVFAGVRELIATESELAGREHFELPYVTHAFRANLN